MTSIDEARAMDRAEPVYLIEVELLNSGPVLYLSDRQVTVAGQLYEDYLHGLSGLGAELRRTHAQGLNTSLELSFRNDPWRAYSYLVNALDDYPIDGAEVTVSEVLLDTDGLPSGTAVLFKGVLEEPREIDLMGFQCRAMSMEFAADNR